MVGVGQGRGVVGCLADVGPLAEDAVGPGGDAGFFARVVGCCADVKFVGGEEGDHGLGVVGEGEPGYHLDVELVVVVEAGEVFVFDEGLDAVVGHADAVVEVAEPDDGVVVVDNAVALELEALVDGLHSLACMKCSIGDAYMEVLVPLIIIGKPSCQMRSDKAYGGIGIFHPNSHSPFITSHARQPSLLR